MTSVQTANTRHTDTAGRPWRLLLLISCMLTVWINARGAYPIVRNFNEKNVGGGTQTWDICQDSLGNMYFANKFGLIRFDSRNWTPYAIGNESEVRSLCYDSTRGRIYAGGSDEFGYFVHDPSTHRQRYVSLSRHLSPGRRVFGEVWNIFNDRGNVWFQADHSLYRHDGRTLQVFRVQDKITASALIGENIYIGCANGRISMLRAGRMTRVHAPMLEGERIVAILPNKLRRNILIVTEYSGIYTMDERGINRMPTAVDDLMRDNQTFCATINDNTLAVGTVNMGLVIIDLTDGSLTFANKLTGMQNNTVLTLNFDATGNLWAGLDNGIDYICYSTPWRLLTGSFNSCGAGYASSIYGNNIYLGTNQGLYISPYPFPTGPEPTQPRRLLNGQVWHIDNLEGQLLASTDGGLFSINGTTMTRIPGIPGTWSVQQLKQNPEYALAATYDNFYLLHRDAAGVWRPEGTVTGFNDRAGHIVQDNNGNIWLAHWLKGIYRLRLDIGKRRFSYVKLYNTSAGLSVNRNNAVSMHNNNVVFSSIDGYYVYDPVSDMMKPHPTLTGLFGCCSTGRLITSPQRDIYNLGYPDGITRAHPTASGNYDIDSTTYISLGEKMVPGFEYFEFIGDRHVIIGSREGFYDLNPLLRGVQNPDHKLIVSKITTLNDSLLRVAEDSDMLRVPYSMNSLRFEFVSPEYRAEKSVTYSFYLEDYDRGWSAPSLNSIKDYTRLSEGKYNLHVRAHNSYDNTQQATILSFEVLPPWYRTTLAKIIYTILVIGMLWAFYKGIKRWSRQKTEMVARKKEQQLQDMKRKAEADKMQKEVEISTLKGLQLEQEVKYKSDELSNVMLHLARKNEVLLSISESLDKMQSSLGESSESRQLDQQLRRLKNKIRDNISHDDNWRSFNNNFDAVYTGFTQRLQQKHPTLTRTELKVCCYLRMGLSSKDIAPLFSISTRSVEMTRYRLRKKLGLERDENLTAYLEQI